LYAHLQNKAKKIVKSKTLTTMGLPIPPKREGPGYRSKSSRSKQRSGLSTLSLTRNATAVQNSPPDSGYALPKFFALY